MIGFGLKLLGMGKWLSEAAGALARWVGRHPWPAAVIALLLVLALTWHGKAVVTDQRDAAIAQTKVQLAKTKVQVAHHRETKRRYKAAQRAAQDAETARLIRVKAQQETINAHASQDYARRLADLRARFDGLRGRAGAGAGGARGGLAVSGVPAAPGGADGAAEDGFSLAERFLASQQGIQLDELISWIERQHAVDPNAP